MKKYLRTHAVYVLGLVTAILFTTSGILFASQLPGTWREINTGLPIAGVGVGALTIDPTNTGTIYAQTSTGNIFKSTNGGASWHALRDIVGVHSLVIDPKTSSNVYVGTSHGIFKTTNGGESWVAANTGLDGGVDELAIDPTTTSTLYAGSYSRGIFKSTNGADSWVHTDTGLSFDTHIASLAVDPIVSSTIYATYGSGPGRGGAIKSINGGESWSMLGSGSWINFNRAVFDPESSSTIYAGASVHGVVSKSVDGGESWNVLNAGLPAGAIATSVAIDPIDSSTIYVAYTLDYAVGGGISKSTDGGISGNVISTGLPPNVPIGSVAIDPRTPRIIYAGMVTDWGPLGTGIFSLGTGVFKSTDEGVTWNAANAGLTTIDIRTLAIDPVNATTVYAGGAGGLSKSIDNGANWTGIFSPYGAGPASVQFVAIDFVDPNILYASAQRIGRCAGEDNLLFKTADGGASWDNSVSLSKCGFMDLLVIDPTDPNTLYLGESDYYYDSPYRLLKSTDRASTWKYIPVGTEGLESNLNAFVIDPTNPAVLYAGTYDYSSTPGAGGLFKSVDGGASWSKTPLGDTAVNVLAIDPTNSSNLYAAIEGVYNQPTGFRGLFKSTDGGASWVAINSGLEGVIASRFRVTALIIDQGSANIIYAATSGGGVFWSTDSGATWAPFNNGLGNFDVRVLALAKGDSKTLYAGTGGGVFAMTLLP